MRIDCTGFRYAWLVCTATILAAFGCDSATEDATQLKPGQAKSTPGVPVDAAGRPVPPQRRGTVASGDVSNELVESLRKQISSDDEIARAEAIQRLGEIRDVDSIPEIMDALEKDASPDVRQNAYRALRRLTNVSVPFDAYGSKEEREAAVKFYRDFWEDYKDPDGPFMQISKNPSLKYSKYGQK